MSQITAKYLFTLNHWRGNARVYKLSRSVHWRDAQRKRHTTAYVVVSTANNVLTGRPETLIFPCKKDGTPKSFMDMKGSFWGGWNHKLAIEKAGWILE